MLKRREWAEKYGVTDRDIYQLYSEFSSIIMIAKADNQILNKARRESLQPQASPSDATLQINSPKAQEPAPVSKQEEIKKTEQRLDKAMPPSHKASIVKIIR